MNSAPILVLLRFRVSWNHMRRLAEIVIACALLIFTLPLMVCVAVAIKCDSPGPVLERERGFSRGRRFTLLAFRTQTSDADELAPKWLQKRTAVGRLLRYTRIDLLPRLINVLRGELSLNDYGAFQALFWD